METQNDFVRVTVHNNLEAQILLREYDDMAKFDGQDIRFQTHNGCFLGDALFNKKTLCHDLGTFIRMIRNEQ